MKRFSLEINLGNAAMLTTSHVARALAEVADSLRNRAPLRDGDTGIIWDVNGNSVGRWSVRKSGGGA